MFKLTQFGCGTCNKSLMGCSVIVDSGKEYHVRCLIGALRAEIAELRTVVALLTQLKEECNDAII